MSVIYILIVTTSTLQLDLESLLLVLQLCRNSYSMICRYSPITNYIQRRNHGLAVAFVSCVVMVACTVPAWKGRERVTNNCADGRMSLVTFTHLFNKKIYLSVHVLCFNFDIKNV